MGNSASTIPKEEEHHPAIFFEGQRAANESRFTVSELCFMQALLAHPGRAFWENLMKAVFHKTVKGAAGGVSTPVSPRETAFPTPTKADGGEGGATSAAADGTKAAPQIVPVTLPNVLSSTENPLQMEGAEQDPTKASTATAESALGVMDSSQASPNKSLLTHQGNVTEAGAATTIAESLKAQALGGTTDVTMPLDGELKDLMNYVRLLADMAHVYLRLLPTTKHEAKVITLAARYTSMTITHTQVLLNIFTLMKDDRTATVVAAVNLHPGHKRHQDSSLSSVEGANESAQTPVAGRAAARVTASEASKCYTLTLVAAECRYYFMSFLINYTHLLIRTLIEQPERKRQNLIYANIMDHLDAVYGTLHELAEEYPDEYVSKVIMSHVPDGNGRGRRTPSNSQGASSHPQSVSASLALSDDAHRHLYAAGKVFSGVQSALTSLLTVHGVRLCVVERTASRLRACIRSPAERMSVYYLAWYSAATVTMVPGRNPYTVEMALTRASRSSGGGASGGPVKEDNEASTTEIVVGPPLNGGNADGRDEVPNMHDGPLDGPQLRSERDNDDERTLSEDIRPQLRKAVETLARGRGAATSHARFKEAFQLASRKSNAQLDLSNPRTLVMVSQEEGCFIVLQALRLSAMLRIACGQRDAAGRYFRATENIIAALYGPESLEIKMTRYSHQVDYS